MCEILSKSIVFDKSWTLFLDRDGVINEKRENDYVKDWTEFSFLEGSIEAISKLSSTFGLIIVVTNQRGVGKGVMTEEKLLFIHERMIEKINKNLGRIDNIYYSCDILDDAECRKPNIGMGKKAKLDFPNIDFNKSVIVGDSISDMYFGTRLGMICVLISNDEKDNNSNFFDYRFNSLFDFSIKVNTGS